jgi:hypothetical protein
MSVASVHGKILFVSSEASQEREEPACANSGHLLRDGSKYGAAVHVVDEKDDVCFRSGSSKPNAD